MLAFQLHDGTTLDLDPRTSLPLQLENPIFDPQRIDRTFSYPLKLPRTPRNTIALGAGRIDAVLSGNKYATTLLIDGVPFERGILKVTKPASRSIGVVFQSAAVDLTSRLEALKLTDLELPVRHADPFRPRLQFEARRRPTLNQNTLVFAVNGVNYFHPFHDAQGWVDMVNADYPGLISLDLAEPTVILISINAIEGIEKLEIDLHPLFRSDPVINDLETWFAIVDLNYIAEARRLTEAFNDLDSESDESPFRLPSVHCPNLFDDKNPGFVGVANRYDDGSGRYSFAAFHGDDGYIGDALLPQPRVSKLLEQLLSSLEFRLAGTLNETEMGQLLIWNNRDLLTYVRNQGPRFVDGDLGGGVYFDQLSWTAPPSEWNLADYAPDLTAQQLLMLFAETFAQIIRVAPGVVRLTSIRQLLVAAPKDWTNKIEPDFAADYGDQLAPVLDYNRQGDENTFPGQLERVQLEAGKTDQQPYIVPVFSTFEQERDVDGMRIRIPTIDEVGRNEHFDLGASPRLRFFFHRGLQPAGTEGRVYPQAGAGRRGYGGQPVGRYSMEWLGEGGLYESWWREYIALLRHNRTDQRVCRLTVADLLELKEWNNPNRSYVTPDGTAVGVVRTVKVRATMQGLSLARVTFQLKPS